MSFACRTSGDSCSGQSLACLSRRAWSISSARVDCAAALPAARQTAARRLGAVRGDGEPLQLLRTHGLADVGDDLGDFFGLDSEQGIELYYNIEVAPWLHISPDIQYIIDPGGGAYDDALVCGIRVQMSF